MGKILNDLSEQLEAGNSEMSVKQEISEQVSLEIPLDGKSELKEDSAMTQQKEHGNYIWPYQNAAKIGKKGKELN